MKVSMNDYGELVVAPENAVERLALQEWVRRRKIGSPSTAPFVIDCEQSPAPPRAMPRTPLHEF